MASVTVRASGPATADEVWNRYRDTRRWSEWAPQIRSVQTSGGHLITPGLTGSVRPLAGPAVRFEIEQVDPSGRTWSWRVWVGPIRLRLDHGVTAHDGATSTWLDVRGPLPVIAGYAPVAYLALRRLVRR
jgi:hypothetical protein